MRLRHIAVAALCLLICTLAVLADTLTLKNGTVLEGKVIPQTDGYWIKMTNGETRVVPKDQVASFTRGESKPKPTVPTTPGVPPAAGTPASPGSATGASQAFLSAKSKADRCDAPVMAVQIWDNFIENNPTSPDLEAAKTEKEKWEKLQKENAERINGKWMSGKERKDFLKKVNDLIRTGNKMLDDGQTIEGIKKLEEALKLYPQSFEANFDLGYYYLVKGAIGSNGQGNLQYMDKAIRALETASKIMPTSAATWSNLSIGYNFRQKYMQSVQVAYKAVKIRENKETVQNLVNSIAQAPPGMRQNNAAIKPIMEDALLMASRHGVQPGMWRYVRPTSENTRTGGTDDPEEKAPPGAAWSGSGFFISKDGYIITNHHVATGDPKEPIKKDITFRVRMDDGTEKNAELIAVDEESDIALMKVKTKKTVPYLKIADSNPKQAAKALVLGYPRTGEDRPSMQISEGSVKSLHEDGEYNVWFDLNTTHGNSGGPIVDKNCRVIGILTAGWQEYNMTIVGGVGPLQIKKFLDKIADKAPKLEYASSSEADFNGEKLTEKARQSTLYILAIRGASLEESTGAKPDAANDDDGGEENTPKTGAKKKQHLLPVGGE